MNICYWPTLMTVERLSLEKGEYRLLELKPWQISKLQYAIKAKMLSEDRCQILDDHTALYIHDGPATEQIVHSIISKVYDG